ncbi:DUF3328 domain containing protein [Pyrenophora tritici-repentis]|nr:DUF3328 domain containing protein [Pyrenophora tritici-repentis]KAI2483726.1 DUF3328 domain containing protein [Pyrenophora tritici-repentis]
MAPQIKYDSVDSDEPTGMDRLHLERFHTDERIRRMKQQLRGFQIATAMVTLALFFTTSFILFSHFRSHAHPSLLGADQSGFVPADIGYPLKWTAFEHTHPLFIEEDSFDRFEKTRATVKRLKAVHNSSNVLTNGYTATYRGNDGLVHDLPTYRTSTGREVYILRSFHQIHCIIVIAEEYGYRVNNRSSQWAPGHVAHCLNTLREAVTCLADATPLSFLDGVGIGHVTDGKQGFCRDYSDLRRWADDPVRRTRTRNVAPEGSDRDVLEDIVEEV